MKIMKRLLVTGFCLVFAGIGCQRAPVASETKAPLAVIHQRLEQAKNLQKAGQDTLLPMEKDLILLANFEADDVVCLGDAGSFPVAFQKSHYRKGKFGRGYYFERAGHNLLPASMADVETDLSGFQALGGARLASADADTTFGKKALSVTMAAASDGFQTVPVKVAWRSLHQHEKEWTLVASTYVKGPKDGKIKIEVAFVPKELQLPPPQDDKKEPERIPDKTAPQEIVLTGEWQRVACTASSDGRLKEREAVFSIKAESPVPMSVLADGFQFEQVAYYPHYHNMPTTWLPGGEDRPATFVGVASPLKEVFPVNEGAIAFWTCTPHESNLIGQGSVYWVSFGCGWAPPWGMSAYRWQAGGEGFAYFSKGQKTKEMLEDEQWHHLAMSWDATQATMYLDGNSIGSFESKRASPPKNLEIFSLVLGGFVAEPQAANSVMDEVAIFRRKLSGEDVQRLAGSAAPLRMTVAPLVFSRSARSVFYRDEAKAVLEMKLTVQPPLRAPVVVDVSIGDQVFSSQTVKIGPEAPEACVEFEPGKLKCGVYNCRVGTVVEGKGACLEYPIEVVPALRPDHYMVSSWGGGGATAEIRAFFKTLGFNTIDTYGTNIEEMGKNGFLYGWHYNFGNGIWSYRNRELAREGARKEAESRTRFPNWKYCLLNSETGPGGMPDAEERKAWFDAWAAKELGFAIPEGGWKFGTSHNPDLCSFLEDEAPADNGVFKISKGFAFMKWWNNLGGGRWRLNAEAAGEIRKIRSDVKCWTDPVRYPGQVADLDAGSIWSYQIAPELLIGEFEQSYACVRGSGKEFYATLGMTYNTPLTDKVKEPDGMEKCLVPTADDLIQQAWLAIMQIPSDGITYYAWIGLMAGLKGELWYGMKHYAEPGSDVKLGAALQNDLIPIGTMLKRVPNAQRPVALLVPESTAWINAGAGGWNWGVFHYGNLWKNWLGRTGIPYDVVLDHNITPGSLARYKAIIFPMAQFVSETVYRELVAAGKSGTRIIVDSHCRQEYPNMERWEQTYKLPVSVWSEKSYNEASEKPLAELVRKMTPDLDAYAVGEQGRVFTNVRECNGVKYISIINDHRQEGPYTIWTKNPAFKPYGKEQSATVYIKAPKESVVYEFTESNRLAARTERNRLVVTINLPPHAGRVLCVYPVEMKRIQITAERKYHLGQPGAIAVGILDARKRNLPGRQLIRATIRDPEGKIHDESGIYRVSDGQAQVPFRPALNDPKGEWQIEIVERTTGLTAVAILKVK